MPTKDICAYEIPRLHYLYEMYSSYIYLETFPLGFLFIKTEENQPESQFAS